MKPAALFPGKVAVGIDARGGKVAVEGWAEASSLGDRRTGQTIRGRRRRGHHLHRHRPRRRADRHQLGCDDRACRRGIDPGRSRPAGLASIADIVRLTMPDAARLEGAISGRALYDGRIDPAEALAVLRGDTRPGRGLFEGAA